MSLLHLCSFQHGHKNNTNAKCNTTFVRTMKALYKTMTNKALTIVKLYSIFIQHLPTNHFFNVSFDQIYSNLNVKCKS
uniref:Uncharacterized protein n=1 Tax=Gouania willdenowi TaxID=441366 RepID=A0A8C5ET60_GOUWI